MRITNTYQYIYTRSDSKVMRLVPKKSYILFIYQLKHGHLQSKSLVPAHTFSSGAATVCSIPGMQVEECSLRPALQTSDFLQCAKARLCYESRTVTLNGEICIMVGKTKQLELREPK